MVSELDWLLLVSSILTMCLKLKVLYQNKLSLEKQQLAQKLKTNEWPRVKPIIIFTNNLSLSLYPFFKTIFKI